MKYNELDKFIDENNLLLDNVQEKPGIYAITIDNKVAYVGQSENVYNRCSRHIYNIENAMLNQEKKYLLLLSAKLGGHYVDCIGLAYGDEDELRIAEDHFINEYDPMLNIYKPKGKNDISELKIEELLKGIAAQVG